MGTKISTTLFNCNIITYLFLFFMSIAAHGNGLTPQSDEKNRIAVIQKFEQDDRSFQEYALLGKLQCYSNVLGLKAKYSGDSELYLSASTKMYNDRSPFLRMFKDKSIKDSLSNHEKAETVKAININKMSTVESYYHRRTKSCEDVFDIKSKKLHEHFLKLVRNTASYRDATEGLEMDDILNMRRDYLNKYLIDVDGESCPRNSNC